jgi:hypothetical protein
MTSRDFCFWLQGVFEVGNVKALDERQTDLIRRHLSLVFVHEIDPSAGGAEHQAKLNEIHGKPPGEPPKIGGVGVGLDGTVYRC